MMLSRLGGTHFRRNALAAALAAMLAIAMKSPAGAQIRNALQQWQTLMVQAAGAQQAHDYTKAERLLIEALALARKGLGPRHADTLTSLNNLAFLYQSQGRYGEAEPLYREALQVRREMLGPRHQDTLTSINNLAALYDAQGRHDDAEPLLREALQGRREALGPRHPDTLVSINNLAMLYRSLRRYSEAEPLLREALRTSREVFGPRHPNTLTFLNNLAALYQDQDRYGEAEPLFRETLQVNRELLGPRHQATLLGLNNLAFAYLDQGRYGDAEPLLREALQASRELLGPRHPQTQITRLNMVRTLVNLDRRADAIQLLRQMEPDVLGWIGQELYGTEAGAVRRRLGVTNTTGGFQSIVLTLGAAGDGDARRIAAAVMLRFKLIQGEEEAFLAHLTRRSQDSRVQTLASDIVRLRATLAAAGQAAPGAFEKTLQALESKRRDLIVASPDYRKRLQVQDASLDDLRRAVPAGAVLIELRQYRPFDFRAGTFGEPRFAGLLLTSPGEPAIADLGPVAEMQPLAAAVAMQGPQGGRGLAPDPTAQDPEAGRGLTSDPAGRPMSLGDLAAVKLYERLFAPFKDALGSAKTVYVAPDGILNLVPFARLKPGDGRYWFERQDVRTLQTGRDLLRPGSDHPARGLLALGGIDFGAAPAGAGSQDSVVSAADRSAAVSRTAGTFPAGFPPLPATASEVKEVAAQYRAQSPDEPADIWSGAEASKARLMALKTPPRVLHLATHGFYLPNQSHEPMLLSGIVLAGANREVAGAAKEAAGNEGLLFALEAEGLNLDGTELVVLSACDTAKGNIDYSEGVFGLARALRTAGARNVLVTLWPLDDVMARDFMADFYRNWLGRPHHDPAGALRDTQLDWIKYSDRRDPRVWAPYVVVE
jgi:CHAT domain-containing protein/tetratricopeptide (TPR) repeat protein